MASSNYFLSNCHFSLLVHEGLLKEKGMKVKETAALDLLLPSLYIDCLEFLVLINYHVGQYNPS